MKEKAGKEDTKRKILNAARKEFTERGYNGARMSSIAKRGDVNQALLHYYFSTKDNLYREVLVDVISPDVHDDITSCIDEYCKNPIEKLSAVLYVIILLNMDADEFDINRLVNAEIARGGEYLKSIAREHIIPRHKYIEDLVQQGVDDGHFRKDVAPIIVMHLMIFGKMRHDMRMIIDLMEDSVRFYEEAYSMEGRKLYGLINEMLFMALSVKREIPHLPDELLDRFDYILEIRRRGLSD